jgi:hypothetical protein
MLESMPEAQFCYVNPFQGNFSRSSEDGRRITEPQGDHVQPTIFAVCGVFHELYSANHCFTKPCWIIYVALSDHEPIYLQFST